MKSKRIEADLQFAAKRECQGACPVTPVHSSLHALAIHALEVCCQVLAEIAFGYKSIVVLDVILAQQAFCKLTLQIISKLG